MASADAVWHPNDDFLNSSSIARFMARHALASYDGLRQAWLADPEWFWGAVAEDLGVRWYEPPMRTLDRSGGNAWPSWFPGGVTNLVLSCVDRHDPERLAYVAEAEDGSVRRMTFGELSTLVSRIAGGLRAWGVGRGDRVGLYLPLVPEALASLYACAKIGALAVPMFSGFGAEPVAARLRHAGARVLLTADGFERRGRRVDMRAVALEAAAAAPSVERVVSWPGDWEAFLAAEPVVDPEPLPADEPFLITYTSGTTGLPKGALHTHGGLPLKSATEVVYHLDQRDGELLFWMTDLGWIVAPLMALGAGLGGRPLLLYDGAPDHPGPHRVAEVVERHGVAILGASPTWARALMGRSDHGFDRSPPSLRVLGSTGEPWTEDAWRWFFDRVGGSRCPIVNLAGGTEAGSLLGAVPIRPLRPCSFNSTAVGVDADVLREDGQPAAPDELGELAVRQPWVGQTKGFWQDDERYLDTYWRRWPDVWAHGDWASRDADGFWYLHGRSDDTMTIAGKRVGPVEVESVLAAHPAVADCAAVGVPHPVKGESIWCFVVLRDGGEDASEELRSLVAERLGRAFLPERVLAVSALPRTRNAKIVRRAIRAAVTGAQAGDLSSLENPQTLDEIRRVAAS
jgi:acetyl-CoA synthetase